MLSSAVPCVLWGPQDRPFLLPNKADQCSPLAQRATPNYRAAVFLNVRIGASCWQNWPDRYARYCSCDCAKSGKFLESAYVLDGCFVGALYNIIM